MTTVLTSTRPEGIHLLISPITFMAGASISTMVGCAVQAWAKSQTGTEIAATTVTVTSATSIEAQWPVGSCPEGVYMVEVYATPSGGELTRICAVQIRVKEKIGP